MCTQSWNFPLIVSILAAIGTIINAWALINYSRINVIHSVQSLILQKSNDCNRMWEASVANSRTAGQGYQHNMPISEIIISFQLLDNCLETYSQKEKRNFLLKQFWIQLNTSLREFIKDYKTDNNNNADVYERQIKDIQTTFQQFFDSY